MSRAEQATGESTPTIYMVGVRTKDRVGTHAAVNQG